MRDREREHATGQVIDDVIDHMRWWELDEAHRRIFARYVRHGRNDDMLFRLVLEVHPEFIPSGSTIHDMRIAAWMHDAAGKPFVTEGDASLWDRTDLTPDDRRKIRNHPEASYKWLVSARNSGLAVPEVALDIALMHHERCNGLGYPNGLAAHEIPPYVQMFSVVDHIVGMAEGRDMREYRDRGNNPSEIRLMIRDLVEQNALNALCVSHVFDVLATSPHQEIPELAFLGDWSDLQGG